jgi:hypothetical protein
LRLSSDPKNSQRSIELIVHSSRHTIRDVQEAAKTAGVNWPLDKSVTNEMLREVLFSDTASAVQVYVNPDYAAIHRDLACSSVNLTLLWNEYCAKCEAQGKKLYQYTQFCEKYHQWARVTKATI